MFVNSQVLCHDTAPIKHERYHRNPLKPFTWNACHISLEQANAEYGESIIANVVFCKAFLHFVTAKKNLC